MSFFLGFADELTKLASKQTDDDVKGLGLGGLAGLALGGKARWGALGALAGLGVSRRKELGEAAKKAGKGAKELASSAKKKIDEVRK
jgi:hypothetical protein